MSNLSAILSGINQLRGGTTQVPVVYPVLATPTAPTAGVGVWVLGAYSQIVAAGVIGTVALVGVYIVANVQDSDEYQFDIAQGGAGAETVVYRGAFKQKQRTDAGYIPHLYVAVTPAVQLTANARLAVRSAGGGGGTTTVGFWVVVQPRPF